ncbi:MAG TPA: endopeptidase La [Candidatus Babeliaceae bacterium]|nr:endopeptidase La [Candidatus Babeliaceae bacterium]
MTELETHDHSNFLALLPLKNVVILPKSIIPIIVGRPSSIKAVEFALRTNKSIFITAQKKSDIENPTIEDVFTYGTRSTILHYEVMRTPKGALKILVEGLSRSRIMRSELSENFIGVYCEDLPTTSLESSIELEALWRQVQTLYINYAQLNAKVPSDLMANVKSPEDMDCIADTLSVHLNLSFDERQMLLETVDLKDRLLKLASLLHKEIDISETEERIRGRIQTQVEKNQREYYLTEQLKAIQKELGREDHTGEITQLRAKIKTLGLSADALEKAEKELRRLEQMPALSSEAVVSRTYLDWLTSLPWVKISKDTISLDQAEKILNKNHAGLQKVKDRIIEFLAAKKFSSSLQRSPIICLVGPPGVGKTSLAHSIAKSLGREFVRISLGGIRDEAEIRGHRRTYIGALPGKIIQAMRKAKTLNPVILLDEIDKMSRDFHGDPAAALLEVLDPEQNRSFVDHFLEVEYDLSKVMFIATANHIDGIPYPLFDRMEIITLPGYTEAEKIAIVENFLIPKLLKEYGLKPRQFKLSPTILHTIITQYTKEAGVRQLERLIAKLMRKTIQVMLKDSSVNSITITPELLKEWLGYPRFKRTALTADQERIGLATGLAWTEFGGDVLEIEVTVLPGKGGLTLTGQLGDVMQESAHAALSYIRSRAPELGLKDSFYSSKDIHIHIPEGATPKDGPSAGITMCVALVSALTRNPVVPSIAMTGEVTLRGRVLPVGGLKEKILAARQYGIKTVLLPQENKDDVEEISKDLGNEVQLIFVSNMDEVLNLALTTKPFDHQEIFEEEQKEETEQVKNNTKEKKLRKRKS